MANWDTILKDCVVRDNLEFCVAINSGALYFISDILNGNILEKRHLEDNHNNVLKVGFLSKGIYQLTIIDGENVYNTKFEKN